MFPFLHRIICQDVSAYITVLGVGGAPIGLYVRRKKNQNLGLLLNRKVLHHVGINICSLLRF